MNNNLSINPSYNQPSPAPIHSSPAELQELIRYIYHRYINTELMEEYRNIIETEWNPAPGTLPSAYVNYIQDESLIKDLNLREALKDRMLAPVENQDVYSLLKRLDGARSILSRTMLVWLEEREHANKAECDSNYVYFLKWLVCRGVFNLEEDNRVTPWRLLKSAKIDTSNPVAQLLLVEKALYKQEAKRIASDLKTAEQNQYENLLVQEVMKPAKSISLSQKNLVSSLVRLYFSNTEENSDLQAFTLCSQDILEKCLRYLLNKSVWEARDRFCFETILEAARRRIYYSLETQPVQYRSQDGSEETVNIPQLSLSLESKFNSFFRDIYRTISWNSPYKNFKSFYLDPVYREWTKRADDFSHGWTDGKSFAERHLLGNNKYYAQFWNGPSNLSKMDLVILAMAKGLDLSQEAAHLWKNYQQGQSASLELIDKALSKGITSCANRSEETLPGSLTVQATSDIGIDFGSYFPRIAPKYLEEPPTAVPFATSVISTNFEDISPHIKYKLHAIDSQPANEASVPAVDFKTTDGLLTGSYLSLQPVNLSKQSRITFVRAGRLANALIPEEKEAGRVVIVVTDAEKQAVSKHLTTNCDVLVIKALPGMGIPEGDDRLKLPTVRMLAAISFAYEKELSNIILMDDNIGGICALDDILPQNSSWQDVYEIFRKISNKEDYICLSAASYRPEKENITHQGVQVNRDILSYKIFYLDIEKVKQACPDPKYLVPQNLSLWGEDIFLQTFLQVAQLPVGSIDRKSLVIVRSPQHRNSCTGLVKKANDWLRPGSQIGLATAPEFYRLAFERTKEIVLKNIAVIERHEYQITQLNLAQLTHRLFTSLSKAKGRKIGVEIERAEKKQRETFLALPSNIQTAHDDFRHALLESVNNILALREENREMFRSAQYNALLKLQAFFNESQSAKQGYFNIATGVGKSMLFLLLSMEASKQMTQLSDQGRADAARHALIIVPEIQLSRQTYAGFNDLSPKMQFDYTTRCIVVNSKAVPQKLFEKNAKFKERKENIVIMCSRSASLYFAANPSDINLFGLTIIDEFHSISPDLLGLFKEYSQKSNTYLLGFSATPVEEKVPYFNEELLHFGTHEGVEEEVLAPWLIDTIPGDFNKPNYKNVIKDLPNIINYRQHPHGGRLIENNGIIYLPSIKKVNKVAKILNDRGFRVQAIHSDIPESERTNQLERFKKGEVKLLLAVSMLKKGTDLPVDYEIIAKKVNNIAEFFQMRGRALRKWTTHLNTDKIAYLILFSGLLDDLNIPQEKAYYDASKISHKISKAYLEQTNDYLQQIRIDFQHLSLPFTKRPREEEAANSSKKQRTDD